MGRRGRVLAGWAPSILVVSPWRKRVTVRHHGELLAARFVLNVWNAHTDWVQARKAGFSAPAAAKRFGIIEAVGVWDRAHLDSVQAWLEEPFFP